MSTLSLMRTVIHATHLYNHLVFYNVSRFYLSVDYFSKMTSLKDEVPRSELVCMLAVPAAYTIHDLVKFTAPVG